ncbi:CpaD family pilus assembly protein [uncultured Cohaesibacter sp.]|uniref:CpaD family pilus assembly protein n=1 Tax=uncultured Cohaesibacter sp. TaxID=1002546 RepID=UPI0029C8586E|nr:CpaD family pilus assembly protein [uncultured Cohaesibacter sp.]
MAMFKQGEIKPMHQTSRQQHAYRNPILRGAAIAVCALMLVGCESKKEVTGSVLQDYRQRHPITLKQAARTLDIPVGVHSEKLTPSSQSAIDAYAREFLRDRSSVIQVMVPSASANEINAGYVAREIRKSLMRQGVAAGRIDIFPYTAADASDAPIRLAYPRVEATTLPCGTHPADLARSLENYQHFDFGCSTQQNLAVAVANPEDLVQPRGWDARDSMHRSDVSEKYRQGAQTWSTEMSSEEGTSSEVGQ